MDLFKNLRKTSSVKFSSNTIKLNFPKFVIDEIILHENRFPVRFTTGVLPFRPYVLPTLLSKPISSPQKIVAFSFLAIFEMRGYSILNQCSIAFGFCSIARLTGFWGEKSPFRQIST